MKPDWPSERYCRHPDCEDTNWGGRGRVHLRTNDACPPDPDGKYLKWEPRDEPPRVTRTSIPAYTINEEEHPSEIYLGPRRPI